MKLRFLQVAGLVALITLSLAGCNLSHNHNQQNIENLVNFTVGGSVSGLSGSGLVLQNNGGDILPVSANGGFTFSTAVASGAAYSVSVLTQPSLPNQDCTVSNGTGTVTNADITTVVVDCIVKSFKLQLGANTIGSDASSNDYGASVAMDAQGNVFVAAETTGSLGETFAGGRDIVLVKANSSGTLQWIKQYGNVTIGAGASGTERVVATAIDNAGNIIIVGTTSGNFGEANAGSPDAFVMKVSPSDGAVIWIRQFGSVSVGAGGSAAENTKGVGVDPGDNIYISGRTAGSLGEANAGSQDLFAAKLDTDGNILWITQLGNVTVGAAANGDDTTFGGLTVDSSGNSYFTGSTRGNLAETNSGSGSTYDFVVVKLDTDGALQWINQLGSVTGGAGSGMNDYDDGIALDASGNVYAVGQTFGSLGEANAGSNDGFVFKLDSSGALQWIKQYGNVTVGAGASASDEFYSVAVGADNNVYISGQTKGNFAETNGGSGNMDVIVLKLDPFANDIFIKQLGNVTLGAAAAGIDTASQRGLVVDGRNRIYVTGSTTGNLFETNSGLNDIFLFKLNENGEF